MMTQNKRLLLVGTHDETGVTGSYARVLKELGFVTHVFDYRNALLLTVPLPERIRDKVSFIKQYLVNRAFAKQVAIIKPDIIFVLKGETLTYKTLSFVKERYNPVLLNFYPDNPFVFWNGNSNENVVRSLPLYDCFLIWSKMLVPALESAGCNHVRYVPFFYDEALFPPDLAITLRDKGTYASGVCFVGTWEPEREQWLEAICKRLPEVDLAIWGNLWLENLSSQSVLRAHVRGSAIYGLERLKAFRLATINLNFIRRQNMTSHNMRTFEVPASGSFLLTQRTTEQATELFREGESIACFDTVGELEQKIRFFLREDEERKIIAERAAEKVKRYKLSVALKELFDSLRKEGQG